MRVFCDIDSTISNHYVRIERNTVNGICSSKAFAPAEVLKDELMPGAMQLNTLYDYHIPLFFLTSRPKDLSTTTTRWLEKHLFKYDGTYFVNNLSCKVDFIKEYMKLNPNCGDIIVIDDFTTGQERGQSNLTFHTEVIDELKKIGCKVFVYKKNMLDIVDEIVKIKLDSIGK